MHFSHVMESVPEALYPHLAGVSVEVVRAAALLGVSLVETVALHQYMIERQLWERTRHMRVSSPRFVFMEAQAAILHTYAAVVPGTSLLWSSTPDEVAAALKQADEATLRSGKDSSVIRSLLNFYEQQLSLHKVYWTESARQIVRVSHLKSVSGPLSAVSMEGRARRPVAKTFVKNPHTQQLCAKNQDALGKVCSLLQKHPGDAVAVLQIIGADNFDDSALDWVLESLPARETILDLRQTAVCMKGIVTDTAKAFLNSDKCVLILAAGLSVDLQAVYNLGERVFRKLVWLRQDLVDDPRWHPLVPPTHVDAVKSAHKHAYTMFPISFD